MIHAIQSRKNVSKLIHGGHVSKTQALGDKLHWSLPGDQHVLVVILCKHLQRGVGHNDLFSEITRGSGRYRNSLLIKL